jgi:hypothetical protein
VDRAPRLDGDCDADLLEIVADSMSNEIRELMKCHDERT